MRPIVIFLLIFTSILFTAYVFFQSGPYSIGNTITKARLDFGQLVSDDSHNIAIVVVADGPKQLAEYYWAQQTLRCYSTLQKYSLVYLYVESNPIFKEKCTQQDLMFRRHCATSEFMATHPQYDWILFLDADIGVINPRHKVEEFIAPSKKFDLVFYDRMYNWEIMAGSYLARNTEYAREFLLYWANIERPKSFDGTDNGLIHEVFMHKFATKEQIRICDRILVNSKNYEDLFKYQACTRHSLGEERRIFVDSKYSESESGQVGFRKVKILPKGKAWVRDGSVMITDKWADSDFMLHGWKNSTMARVGPTNSWAYPFETTEIANQNCSGEREEVISRNWSYKMDMIISDEKLASIFRLKIAEVELDYVKMLNKVEFH